MIHMKTEYDLNSRLWANTDEHFFRDQKYVVVKQKNLNCVVVVLATLSGASPDHFKGVINTQNPVSWSEALKSWGMKLAYCPCDIRKLRYYMEELIELDDLFLLSYYTPVSKRILKDPNENGWIGHSHIVILHGANIYDSKFEQAVPAKKHICNKHYTKRIFRVVPIGHDRGL